MQFTLFVILPSTNDVCTLRNVQHGTTIREIRCRLELEAGIPAQIYRLHSSDGKYMHEEHCLLLDQNVWDGFLLRTQLFDSWVDLYDDIINDRVDKVIKNGAVRSGDNMATEKSERKQLESIIKERGAVAIYIAAFRGLFQMCSSLLETGVSANGRTPFGRSPLYAAICRDNDVILDLLVQAAADLDVKDERGETILLLARRLGAKLCFRKLRLYNLDKNGLRPLNGMAKHVNVNVPVSRKIKVNFEKNEPPLTHVPRPPTSISSRRKEIGGRQSVVGHVNDAKGVPDDIHTRPSSQCFVWDIDDKTKRNSGTECKLQTLHDTTRPKSVKNAVRWKDELALNCSVQISQRGKSAAYPVTILKNRSYTENFEKRSNLIRTLSRESIDSDSSTVKSDNAPSQPDSELTLVSAPGDVSRLNTSDCRSVVSEPATSGVEREKTSSSKGSRHKGSIRLLPFRRRKDDRNSSAKRQIHIAENQQQQQQKFQNAETFDQWLERKRLQECRERLTSQSEDSSHESDSDGSKAYDDWMQKRGRRKLNAHHQMTVEELYRWKDRPLRGVVMVGQAQIADTEQHPEPTDNNQRAYQNWKQKRPQHRSSRMDTDRLKIRLEKKRQQLLAAAITYEDWLEHAEEKKLLMQKILKADINELERIEEENLKKRSPRQLSFDKWNSSLLKKEMSEKRQQEEERKMAEALKADQMRSSSCVTHNIWLEKKRQAMKPKSKDNKSEKFTRSTNDKDAAFASWVRRKQLQEVTEVEEAENGRELLKMLKNKRQELSVPSY